ncbi:hypothetical protein [uncultured Hymenobacter sp.]|uniref:hypothetical protein n=1 Tax=uncultured Hymenobacter sp. TaxID=170016 RepID=UPI0035C9CF91
MKYVLPLLVLIMPSIALAQQQRDVTPLSSKATSVQILDVQKALQGSANPRGFTLAKPANLYRHLADTVNKTPALRLHPGDNVIIQKQFGHWIKVVRGNAAATNFTKDTSSYYIPASAREGTRTFILL